VALIVSYPTIMPYTLPFYLYIAQYVMITCVVRSMVMIGIDIRNLFHIDLYLGLFK
jgi:hypothetical protein